MNTGIKILIIALVIALAAAAIGGGVSAAAIGGGVSAYNPGGDKETEYKYVCEGVIDTYTFSTDADIKDVECLPKECGFLDNIFGELAIGLGSSGEVAVVANSKIIGTDRWDATLGFGTSFSIETSCVKPQNTLYIKLFNDDGRAVKTVEYHPRSVGN